MASISAVSGSGGNGSTSAAPADSLGKQEFLQLLVMQLKNQDPLNPLDDREFIAQMAQLSTLDATTGLASQVKSLVETQQQIGAAQLVGRDVEYIDTDGKTVRGHVTGVRMDSSPPVLLVGDQKVPVGWVQTVL